MSFSVFLSMRRLYIMRIVNIINTIIIMSIGIVSICCLSISSSIISSVCMHVISNMMIDMYYAYDS